MFRVVAIVVIAVLLIAAGAIWWVYESFARSVRADIARLEAAAVAPRTRITAAMLDGLPEPARRYLLRAGVVGSAVPTIVRLRQVGRIRSSADSAWMPFEADETYSVSPPGFVWRVELPSRAVPLAVGRDEYLDGAGSILVKLGAVLPMADEHGPELTDAGLMRFLNEMTSFPAAMLLPNVRIEAAGEQDAFRLTISDRGAMATGVMVIDAEGLPVTFRALRYNTGTRSIETWETPFSGHGRFEGLELPSGGAGVWKLPAGDLDYIELTMTTLEYEG